MKINNDFKLVFPVRYSEAGEVLVRGYHTPISREVFEANYRVISATAAEIFGKDGAFAAGAGPHIASIALKDNGKRDALAHRDVDQDGNPRDGGAKALLAELKRLTLIIAPGPNGFESVPVDEAIRRDVIDADDWADAESVLVFFTCGSQLVARAEKKARAEIIAGALKAQITYSTLMELSDSSQTSTPAAPSQPVVSSVPS